MDQLLNILIADDDSDIIAGCLKLFKRELKDARVFYVQTPEECRSLVGVQIFDIVFLDINFDDSPLTGLDLLPEIKTLQPTAKVFILSSNDDQQTMLKSLHLGAADFISKKDQEVISIVNVIKSFNSDELKINEDMEEGRRIATEIGIAYISKSMTDIFSQVAFARRNLNTTVLITGETGVGKEVIATAITLRNKEKNVVTVDCGAIPMELAESEFFGHVKGSFTGAVSNKQGKFQLANGGDLFLDEIGNLKSGIQEKLLRATQTKEITPVGDTKAQKVNVRLIFATNENLEEMVEQGKFRQDFLERIKGIWIKIPPLRERAEDIPLIIKSLLSKADNPNLEIAPSCLSILCGYSWPGNVRELESVVQQMISQAYSGPITVRHLPERFIERLKVEEVNLGAYEVEKPHVPGVYSIPLRGTFEEAQSVFARFYLTDRYERLGTQASKRQLAKDLQLARSTLDRYVTDLKLDFVNRGGE